MDDLRHFGLNEPVLDSQDEAAVVETIRSGWLAVGSSVSAFEEALAHTHGCSHAIAVNSGTAALHTILHSLGLGENDGVIIPSTTFIATANAVRYTGATPVVLDIDDETWQLNPLSVHRFLSEDCTIVDGQLVHEKTGLRVRAMIPVHLLGHAADMKSLRILCANYNVTVVEDACEAMGTRINDRSILESCDYAALSFNGNKIISLGGGGAILTNRPESVGRLRALISQARDDRDDTRHTETGFNYRLSNIAASLGLTQIKKLKSIIQTKRAHHALYENEYAKRTDIFLQRALTNVEPNFWVTGALFRNLSALEVLEKTKEKLGFTPPFMRRFWQPLHLGAGRFISPYPCPVAENLYEKGLMLPTNPRMSSEQIRFIANLLASLK